MKTEVLTRRALNRISSKNNYSRTNLFSKLIIVSSLLLTSFQLQAGTELHIPISLYDEQGEHVLVSRKAYSSKESCGGCHDYDAITSAYHFDMGRSEARDDFGIDHGVSALVSPGYFGGYNCMGSNNPDRLAKKSNASKADFSDKGTAGWVQRCVGCHTGGGWMEKDRNGKRYDETDPKTVAHLDGDYFNRGTDEKNLPASLDVISQWDWEKSGVVEADCFLCHADFSALIKTDSDLTTIDEVTGNDTASDAQSHAKELRRTMLVRQGFFNYAGTGILEFLNLNNTDDPGEDKTLLTFSRDTDSVDAIHMSTKPNYALTLNDNGKPIINWNADAFDANEIVKDKKVAIPMLRFPENENCMACHRTSNSRRGFYGFGDDAIATYDEDGFLVEDDRDDVHKGGKWTENGVERPIENCNSCHSRNFYKLNPNIHANHNFLKGNSDMDLRNDLDYNPDALSCVYCHETAENPWIPSLEGSNLEKTMLNAHREIWKFSDFDGYPNDPEILSRITQTHLDVITCQACHINDKVARGRNIHIMYRYRQEEDGKLKIIPYAQKDRYYWKDKNSNTILNQTERNSVFKLSGGDTTLLPCDSCGDIIEPGTSNVLGTVSARESHGSIRFGDPEDYAGYLALHKAYNNVFKMKGIENANAVMVLTEANQYIMNHNTRPAVDSLQCEDCHKKLNGISFSPLVADDSILGSTNSQDIFTLPDARLISEGIVELDKDYMKFNADAEGDGGVVSINVSDILYSTRFNPSLSLLNKDVTPVMSGMVNRLSYEEAARLAGISKPEHIETIRQQSGDELFIFSPVYGDPSIRKVALMPMVNSQTELMFPTYQFKIALANIDVVRAASGAGFGGLNADVFSLQAMDTNGDVVSNFGNASVFVKLPYTGSEANVEKIKLITSVDGNNWSSVDAASILLLNPQTDSEYGYLVFNTSHFSYYTIASTDETNTSASDDEAASGGGGGSVSWLLLLLPGFYMRRFRNKK